MSDGVYAVRSDANGHEIHERIAEPGVHDSNKMTRSEAEQTANIETRDNTNLNFYCGCAFPIDPANTDAAVADLKGQVTGGTTLWRNYYSIRGNVVAFSCAYDYYTSSNALATNFADITNTCGRYIAGTVRTFNGNWLSSVNTVGYMQYTEGLNFCATATSSQQHIC